jgi:hypothetical protein
MDRTDRALPATRVLAAPRRAVVGAVVGALLVSGMGAVLAASLLRLDLAAACGRGDVLRMPDGSRACVHRDEPPPGVDVTAPVSTAELRRRVGAGPAAYAAAQELGVPTAVASTGTSPEVTCDGDGTSGFRTQPMYVVEAGKPNRHADLLPTFQKWAAGVDDVVNRSAALTGGVRHVRYVTRAGSSGTCVADVLNVTVPNGAMSSFNATISAVQALGYADPNRKYLMWTDANSLCGVASMYISDSTAQSNPNNGAHPQYARIDTGCWGGGNGTWDHSVEAHELSHTLGGVQSTAPHGTTAGHCWDESDTMCYADGGGKAMVQVCPSEREYLLDCNSDDYFSTFPDPGSWLDRHWNAAASRFLVGGGDGTDGGTAGIPTVFGARIAVNNPAVPGLATQATAVPVLPAGRTLVSVAWRSARPDCSFDTPADVQSTVTCAATAAAPTTVSATLTDSSGATRTVTSPLTFATGTARPLTAVLSVAGQHSDATSRASMCTSTASPVAAVLTDAATGLPVKGLGAAFTKQTAAQTAPVSAGAGSTDITGRVTVNQTAAVPTTYAVRTNASPVYAAMSAVTMPATVARCSPTLTAEASSLGVYYADPVTVSGTLTRTVGGEPVPVGGATLPVSTAVTTTVSGRTTTRTTALGSARTAADGSYSLVVRPTSSGRLSVALPGSTGYVATSASAGDLTVEVPASALVAAVDRADVGYGLPVVVTGRLERVIGGTTTPAAGLPVSVTVTPAGRTAVAVGTAKTAADGSFRLSAPLKASGTLSASYVGSAGLPAAATVLGEVTAGSWTTTLTASPSVPTTTAGAAVTVTGSLSRSYGGTTGPAPGVAVRLYSRASGAVTDTVSPAVTTATGTFSFRVAPGLTTSYTVKVGSVPGYRDAAVGPFTVTVGQS